MASENEELPPSWKLKLIFNQSKHSSVWSISEESGYSSDTSSASTRSQKILELRHSSSDETFSSLLTPELKWKSRLRISSTPYSSSEAKHIKGPTIIPIIDPLLKSKKNKVTSDCSLISPESKEFSSSQSSHSPRHPNKVNREESPKCVKQRFKEIGRKSLCKFRSPLKSSDHNKHKALPDKSEITNNIIQKEGKDKSVRSLFIEIPCKGDFMKRNCSLEDLKKYATSESEDKVFEINSSRLSIQNDSGFDEEGNHSQLVQENFQVQLNDKRVVQINSRDYMLNERLPKQNDSGFVKEGDDFQIAQGNAQTHSSIINKSCLKVNSEKNNLNEKVVNKEIREKVVKQLFIDKIDSPPRRVSPRLSNIVLKIMNESPYMLPKIFSYLSAEELVSVSQVNHCFRQAILKTRSLNLKIEHFFDEVRIRREKFGKENMKYKEALSVSHYAISSPRKHLQQLQNTTESPKKAQVASSVSLFDKFVREGKKLVPGEIQMKCVQCHNPARVLQSEYKAICSKKTCGYIYCTRCSMPFHARPSDCLSLKPRPKISSATKILTKACKKRLRRL